MSAQCLPTLTTFSLLKYPTSVFHRRVVVMHFCDLRLPPPVAAACWSEFLFIRISHHPQPAETSTQTPPPPPPHSTPPSPQPLPSSPPPSFLDPPILPRRPRSSLHYFSAAVAAAETAWVINFLFISLCIVHPAVEREGERERGGKLTAAIPEKPMSWLELCWIMGHIPQTQNCCGYASRHWWNFSIWVFWFDTNN